MTRGLRLLCYALLAFGLAVALYSAALRVEADAASRNAMVLVDWRELNQLEDPTPSHVTVKGNVYIEHRTFGDQRLITNRGLHHVAWDVLGFIPGATISYGEETVGDLLNQGILSPAGVSTTSPTYVVSDSKYQDDIARGAKRHDFPTELENGKLLVEVPTGGDGATAQPLCWRSDVIALAKSKNVPLLLRPSGTQFYGPGGLEETLRFCSGQRLVLFQGTQVPGFPYNVKAVADILKQQRQVYGWVEFDDQDGGGELANRVVPYVARVHSITSDEMEKYTVESATARYQLALNERGIRVLFLRPFTSLGVNNLTAGGDAQAIAEHGFRDNLAALNSTYFMSIGKMIADSGFTIGTPQAFHHPPGWLLPVRAVAISLATIAGALLLIGVLVPTLTQRWVNVLLILGVLASLGAAAVHSLYSVVLLATGIIFPTLGFWCAMLLYQRHAGDKPTSAPARLGWALLGLVCATAVSALGGLLIHGGMWDVRSLLHIDQYRGVTIALALPVLLAAAYTWQSETLQEAWDSARGELAGFWQRFTTLWLAPIRYGDIAVLLLAVGALGIVLLRSGNEGPVGVIGAEGSLRSMLSHALAVRPRTKELLGHPLLVAFLVSLPWRSRLSLLFALGGILGQVSVLNTFEHLHTPLLITVHRVGLGLLIGLITGALLGAVALALGGALERKNGAATEGGATETAA